MALERMLELPSHPIPDRLGLEFTQPSADEVRIFSETIAQIASALDHPLPKLLIPAQGFLAKPLTLDQKKVIDDEIDELYSAWSVDLQESVHEVAIREKGERMVNLTELFSDAGVHATFTEIPYHPACLNGWGGKPQVFWTRETVAHKMLKAGRALNTVGVSERFESVFRPDGVQEGLFQRRVDWTRRDHPDWEMKQVLTAAKSKTAVSPWLAGHKSGAAADITLSWTQTNEPLDLGNKHPEGGALVVLECPFITWKQFKTRQLFATTMRMAGLAVYPGEDWHVSSEDVGAAIVTDAKETFYGPIKGFDPKTGEIDPYDPADYYKTFEFEWKPLSSL